MNKYKECNQCPHEFNDKNLEPCKDCVSKKKTNADRIREMNDEELAGLTIDYNDYYGEYYCSDGECYDYYEDAIKHEIKWLQSEAE